MNAPIAFAAAKTTRPDSGWRLFLRTIVARAYPRVVGQQREKAWLFFETFIPFVAIVSYVYVYRALDAPPDYIGFVVIGGAMTAFWINVMWNMSAQLYWEKDNGNLPLYIIAPNSLMAILLGMALGGMLATTLRAIVIVGLGTLLFHVPFALSSAAELAVIFVLSMAALYGLGMMLASVFLLHGRNAFQIVSALQEPVYFITGFYFPIRSFGFTLAVAVSAIPLTLGLDAMRQLMFASGPTLGLLSVRMEMAILAVLAIVFVYTAKLWLDHMERRAVQEGALTDRRR
jgi:ABC-2 type transport system permease protein